MTAKTTPLTDDLLRRALAELADGPDGSLLLTDVLSRVETTPQVTRRPWDTRGWGRTGMLLVAALLLIGVIGTAVVLSSPKPDPQPQPTASPAALGDPIRASAFVVPFTYRLPPGVAGKLTVEGTPYPAAVYAWESVDYAPRTRSRFLRVFVVNGSVHHCGDNTTVDTEPSAFFSELRDRFGPGIGPVSATTLGNLPALAADIDTGALPCRLIFHAGGFGLSWEGHEPALKSPSRMIVARTGDTTIAAVIGAGNEADLAEWLSIAQQYVDSFRFEVESPIPAAP